MRPSARWLPLLVALAAASGCTANPAPSPLVAAGAAGGIGLEMGLSSTGRALVVEARVANERSTPVHLVPDQCGRVTEALLARTVKEPEGETWTGSAGALKSIVLDRQEAYQAPERFHPRRPRDTSSQVPACDRPERPLEVGPGEEVRERWELPVDGSRGLTEVGSDGVVVRLEVLEARGPDEMEYLDVLSAGSADAARSGRNVRIEAPASGVITRAPTRPPPRPSLGELFDRLLEDRSLRAWVDAQAADGWRQAELRTGDDGIRFKAVTTAYERAAVVTGDRHGAVTSVTLPVEADRTRTWERRPATLPTGVGLVEEREAGIPSQDVLLDPVTLPSGRIVVGEYLLDEEPLGIRVAPGDYPVHATLARYPDEGFESVALLTLVLSDQPTTRWQEAGAFAVDGGTASITSPEGVDAMRAMFERDESEWWAHSETVWDSLSAHDQIATEWPIDARSDLVMSTSGFGDGVYPVHVGYDAAGTPTSVVLDFLLIHLDWPAAGVS